MIVAQFPNGNGAWQTPRVEHMIPFLAISTIVIVTPGQDTVLTIRNTLSGTRRTGAATAAGVATGQALWSLAASLGVTAVLVASEPLFAAIKLVGAAYLIYLGLTSLWHAVFRDGGRTETDAPPASEMEIGRAYRQGVLSNLGNPKMAIFFSSLLPQLVPAGGATFAALLGMGLVFSTMTLVWLICYAIVVARAGDILRRSPVRRAIEAMTGAVLAALGLSLLLEPRRS